MGRLNAMESRTQRGHEEPLARQFSVFLANRVGQLKDLLDVLDSKELAVLGLTVVDSTDWAVLRLVFSDPNKAREVLRGHGVSFTESRVLLVELHNGQALADVCDALVRAEVSIHFAFPLTLRSEGHPVMVLQPEDTILAQQVLARRGFNLIGDEDLADEP
ncbi:MAG: acetolactate synthase [Planctomycetota bacterium]